jgi:hypothetical protein
MLSGEFTEGDTVVVDVAADNKLYFHKSEIIPEKAG